MKIILATNNEHKVQEIRQFLNPPSPLRGEGCLPAGCLVGGEGVQLISLKEYPSIILKEEGSTLRENALQKARTVANATGVWALADDTGLFVDALDGKPGIYSARYAGPNAVAKNNIEKLLKELASSKNPDRSAYFSCVLALVHADGREITLDGRLEGTIAQAESGKEGFGYDPIFYLPERRCTLAEISLEGKNLMSHRGCALVKLRAILEEMSQLEEENLAFEMD